MGKLFLGMIFIFINININNFDILPNFIGFFILASGVNELADQSEKFVMIKPYVLGLAIYGLIMAFFIFYGENIVSVILGIVYTVISIYSTYTIITAIMDMENKLNVNLETEKLMSSWKIMVISYVLALITKFIIPTLSFVLILANILFAILYLVSFNNTKNLYYESNH